MTERNVRRVALSLLCRYEEDDTFVNITVPRAARELPAADRALLTALVYGTVERRITLDYYIGTLASSASGSLELHTRCALRLGLYQLAFMDSIPDHAAVNETVKLALGRGEASYLNGILREFVRRGKSLPLPEYSRNPARYISIKHSYPLALVRRFISLFGEERAVAMLEQFNSRRPLALKVNTLRCSVESLAETLGARPSEYAPDCLLLDGAVSPTSLPGWEEGHFFVEGISSRLAVSALGARSGERVLDACAAPGGKSFSAAIDMEGRGEVVSCELYEGRLGLISDGARRLGIDIIRTVCRDSTEIEPEFVGAFDRVLCDVPCSGWGVLGAKPDLRYRCFESAERMPPLQSAILAASSRYVKPGGTLVYSTCTLNPDENERVVEAFLRDNADFAPCDFSVGSLSSEGGILTLTPEQHGVDGFFIAKLTRRA